jgi:hypothetical protein
MPQDLSFGSKFPTQPMPFQFLVGPLVVQFREKRKSQIYFNFFMRFRKKRETRIHTMSSCLFVEEKGKIEKGKSILVIFGLGDF